MDEYTEFFLRYAFIRCERCGKEMKYDPELPRSHVFLHLSEEDGKLHFVNPKTVEPYCLDCMWELTGGKSNDDNG